MILQCTDFQIVKELLVNNIYQFYKISPSLTLGFLPSVLMSKSYRIGGAREDRTPDLLRARQALSQLSYGPILLVFCANQGKILRSVLLHMSNILTPSSAKVVGLGGFEPPTSPLSGVRSNQLSYRPRLILSQSK